MWLSKYPGPEEVSLWLRKEIESFKVILHDSEMEHQTLQKALILQHPDVDLDSAPQLRVLIGKMKLYSFLIAYYDQIDDWQGERMCCSKQSELHINSNRKRHHTGIMTSKDQSFDIEQHHSISTSTCIKATIQVDVGSLSWPSHTSPFPPLVCS